LNHRTFVGKFAALIARVGGRYLNHGAEQCNSAHECYAIDHLRNIDNFQVIPALSCRVDAATNTSLLPSRLCHCHSNAAFQFHAFVCDLISRVHAQTMSEDGRTRILGGEMALWEVPTNALQV